jgi:hypothetical protein
MDLTIDINTAAVKAAMDTAMGQAQYAVKVAINKSAELARDAVKAEMTKVFDRPTPWVMNSLRVKYAKDKRNPVASVGFKDKNSAESSRTMIAPHVEAGTRHYKAMEARLMRMGLMPAGWNAVPGGAAKLDSYGNMGQGQITQLLNVLGTYTEAGYNKANAATVARLAKGNKKKNVYGFVYWVNRVGNPKGKHLRPGVYQRINTAFGSSLKPVLIFVRRAAYKQRLDFDGIAQATVTREFPEQFAAAFEEAMRTAIPKTQGSLL